MSFLAGLSEVTSQCDTSDGCAYSMVETVQMTASTGSPDGLTSLPLSIVPSDVLGSLVGSSIPATLITDTGSIDAPASTRWYSPSMTSVFTSSGSPSIISITQTHQSNDGPSLLPVTAAETRTSSPQLSPTTTGVSTLIISIASTSASASASADSSEQSAGSTRRNELSGLNVLTIGILCLEIALIAAWW